MSTWISESWLRRGVLTSAACLLAACEPTAGGGAGDSQGANFLAQFGPSSKDTVPLKAARLAEGSVVVAAPEGYCIDPSSFRDRDGGAFALVASCQILSGGKEGISVPPVIMTVTIAPEGTAPAIPSSGALAIAVGMNSVAGKSDADGIAMVQVSDGGDGVFTGADPQFWRGALRLHSRLVGLALYAPEGSSFVGLDGEILLRRFAGRLKAQNPDPVTVATKSLPHR